MKQHLTAHPEGSKQELWTIAFPLIVSSMSSFLMLFFDRLILARYSTSAMNAAVAGGMTYALFIYGAIHIASIGGVLVGQLNGSKQYKKLGEPVWQMIWFSIMTLIVFIPAGLFLGEYFVPEEYYADGIPYHRILMLAGVFSPIFTALSGFFVGQGKSKSILVATTIGNLTNLILDIILVFGISGWINPMGTVGAAAATAISALVQVLILASMFFSKKNILEHGTLSFRFQPKTFLKCIRIGTPNSISHMIEIGAWTLFIHWMAHLGELHMTVTAVGQSIMMLFIPLIQGVEKGVSSIASNYIGARKPEVVSKLLKSAVQLLIIMGLCISPFFIVFPDLLIELFMEGDKIEAIRDILIPIMHTALIFLWFYYIFDGIVWIFAGILTAAGDTLFLMYINCFSVWTFAILPLYLLIVKPGGSANLIWPITLFYAVLNSTCYYLRYRTEKWRDKEVIESAQEIAPN